MIDKVFPKVHSEGYKFLVIFGVITLIFYFINSFLGLIGLVLTIWFSAASLAGEKIASTSGLAFAAQVKL